MSRASVAFGVCLAAIPFSASRAGAEKEEAPVIEASAEQESSLDGPEGLRSGDLILLLHHKGIQLAGGAQQEFDLAMAQPENQTTVLLGRSPKPKASYPLERYKKKFRWPVKKPIVSSVFGPRWEKKHEGIDLATPVGVPVYAIAPGQILYAGDEIRGYGNCVVVQHDRHVISLYAHNDSLSVETGQKVKAGQLLSRSGNTGHSTGPHLHFEIRDDGIPLDPLAKLPKGRAKAKGAKKR